MPENVLAPIPGTDESDSHRSHLSSPLFRPLAHINSQGDFFDFFSHDNLAGWIASMPGYHRRNLVGTGLPEARFFIGYTVTLSPGLFEHCENIAISMEWKTI